MTYGDRMSARHRRPDDSDPSDPGADPTRTGPVVGPDGVVLRVGDPEHLLDGVRLEVDWMLGEQNREFSWADGRWTLELSRPAAWRIEYQLTLRRDGDTVWTPDPDNPRRVPNPFGDKSEIRFPEYREPNWLLTPADGPVTEIRTPNGRLTQPVPVKLWSPAGLPAATAAPLLLVHDGSDMADRGHLLSWAAEHARTRPLRVALLDPPHGLRDQWYSADPDYSAHMAEVVLPALTSRVLTGPIVGLGASLGALAMLTLQRRHPGSVSGLALQSGSFFTATLDPQESGYSHFDRICAAVRQVAAGPDLSVDAPPRSVPTLITCGAIEENRFNNEAMADALRAQQYPLTFRLVPDAHTMIGWRDAWYPALNELLRGLR
ncbi:Enterochelin esterase-like protein [Nakamurella multipartita DSM 44233]|uniref:Enterochelin esterase-like protein n=2 Tax=Nakamurella TaxID=53460 RepID=C8XCZ1_NAKMY|nr:Enterochelin esterase-like protein [Nakamurella multipartita DSM 44233]